LWKILDICLDDQSIEIEVLKLSPGIFGVLYNLIKFSSTHCSSIDSNVLISGVSDILKDYVTRFPAETFELLVYTWIHFAYKEVNEESFNLLVLQTGVGTTSILTGLIENLKNRSDLISSFKYNFFYIVLKLMCCNS
jgi:hypothetical protein